MALPLSGPLKMGDIRTELGMSISNFSLINASVGGVVGYPTLNIYSFYRPNSPSNAGSPYKISEWYGYDHNIGYVEITGNSYVFQCDPINVTTDGYQYIEYFNKLGASVPSPYNISINGILALPANSPAGPYEWNTYSDNGCIPSISYGAYIAPTSVVITGTTKKVWVFGTGFL
jgi:hypothetical protein